MNPKIAVLVPCYNEALTIEKVVKDFQHYIPEAEIFVYDNNSKDATIEIATKAGATVGNEKQEKRMLFSRMSEKLTPTLYHDRRR
jgi:glycosyltransferase involved in cell wall biosynthesis